MSVLQRNNVTVAGHGTRAMLFAHGYGCDQHMWRYVAPAFEDDYKVVLFDYVGSGKSDLSAYDPQRYAGLDGYAQDVLDVCHALDLRDVVLVGHSMGGATAMQFAVDHPELLRALVLVDPAGPDGIDAGVTDVEATVDARITRRSPVVPSAWGPEVPAEFSAALAADMNAAPEQRLRGSYRSMLTLRIGDAVSRLPMPILLIGGDNDQTVPLRNMLDTYRTLPPDSGLHVWHGVGHFPNVETPERFTRVLRRFVERTVPTRRAAQPVG